jgi:hypothetical protein
MKGKGREEPSTSGGGDPPEQDPEQHLNGSSSTQTGPEAASRLYVQSRKKRRDIHFDARKEMAAARMSRPQYGLGSEIEVNYSMY